MKGQPARQQSNKNMTDRPTQHHGPEALHDGFTGNPAKALSTGRKTVLENCPKLPKKLGNSCFLFRRLSPEKLFLKTVQNSRKSSETLAFFLEDSSQSGTSRVAARVSLRMALDACAATPRAPHGWLHVSFSCRMTPRPLAVWMHGPVACIVVTQFVDHSIGANQHGDQDVLNNFLKNFTEVRSSDRTDQTDRAVARAFRLELRLEPRPDDRTDRTGARLPRPTRHSKTHDRARLSLGREETKDGHAFSSGGPSGQFRKSPYLYPDVWTSQEIKPQQDVYFPFKTIFEKEQLIFDKKQFASNGFDFVQKQRKRQNRCDDEKWIRSGDRPFTKAKRSNRDVPDQNELLTYARWEKMLHKVIHVVRQLKKKGNTNTSSAPKQQSNSSSLSNSDLKTNVSSSDKSKAVKTISKALSTRFVHPTVPIRLTEPSRVCSDWSFGDRTDRTGARLPRPTRNSKTHGRARLSLGRDEDGHAFSTGGLSGQSRKRPYLCLMHPSGSDEPGHYLKGHL
uniref:Uncharacterized protein n=1 Tax=Brassica oleracea var. oleracea TaxID=109376 RepID=A0A0D3AK40_BRAOL